MTKRKERTVRELYHVTQPIFEAEMTPVLEGNYRIQGPLEETHHTLKKTGSSRSEKRSGKCCATGNVSMKAETGTCNVCAAPCSSCGHFNQAGSCMEIKAENEFSDEVSRVNAASRCSSKDASVMPSYKRRECGDRKPTASETSNLVSASSSHDSMSENAESKASLRMSDSNEEEMLQKDSLGRGDARDHHFSHGEDASCVSGANDACASVRDVGVDVDRKSVSCSAASIGSFIPEGIQKICRNQSDPDWYTGSQSKREVNCNNSKGASFLSEEYKPDHPIGSELLKSDPSEITLSKDIKGFKENFSSQHPAKHVQSSPAKLKTITGAQCFSAPKSEDAVSKLDNNKGTLVCTSSSEIPMKDNSCLEPGVLVDTKELPAKSMDCIEVNEQKEKSSSLFKVPNNQDPPLKSQPLDVSDGSDIVEDDVKVCDICGDAGREDLLAICSRCSDGAEHTYCMRIMMDKVPEGDWLCEVCQMKEEANQRKNKHETVLGAPKISCSSVKTEKSAGTLKSNISLKSDSQLPDTEPDKAAKVAPSPRLFPKRHPDTLDLASTAKRKALESNAGSPKPSSPIKPKALSRESSFKNLDKGKLNAIHPMPPLGGSSSQDTTRFPALSVQNSSKIYPQLQSSRGALSKSSSFNTSNSKAKVKMVQEVPQKHKLGRHSSIGGSRKEGLVKTINKSSSFSMGSSHSNPIESKPKVHSPNVSRAEDSRGFKPSKERNIIEKKNSFKSDRLVSPASASNIISPRDDKKVSPRGEATTLPSSISKFRDSRAVQADFKSSSSSKSTAGRGDFKRQSSLVSRSSGYSSFNGNVAEQKSSQAIKKVEIAANLSATADGPSSNSDMVTQDSFPSSRECMGLDTKGEETSFNLSRQSVPAGGKSIRCHKCKEIGHASQFCPNGSIRVSVPEAATAKSSRDIMNRISKLKDANEADLVTSSEICKKSGDQSDELFMSRAGLVSEVAPEDQLSNSLNRLNNSTSSDAAYDRQESFKNCTGKSSTAVTDVSYNAFQPTREVCTLNEVDINAIVSLDGNQFRPSSCDLQTPVPSSSIPLRGSPIPDLDYLWQGGFEVHRGGRHVDYDGIQAHLSTSASPKVLEVVDKLPHKVLLEEVSCLSTWPTQFQNCATEDNIALYFFAKDVESYGRSYETLVENMMKNDLALKGILNGIELLIFPSNKLCENSKRWNMFYYLWGVFRAKRVNLSKKIDGSLKIPFETNLNLVPLEVGLSSPIVNATQNESSSGNIDEELHTSGRLMNRHEALPSTSVMQFPSSPGSGRIDLNAEEESFCDQNCLGLESSSLRHIADSDSSLMIPSSNVQSTVKIKGNGTSTGWMTDQIRYTIVDQEKVMDEDTVDANYVLENGPQKSDLVENNDGTWVVKGNHKRPYSVMVEMGPQTSGESSACTSQQARWKENTDIILVDEESEYKKKRVCSETYSNESSRGYNPLTERYSCQMLDLASSLPLKEQVLEGANDCAILPDSLMTTERYFFPVESGPSKGIGMRGNSIPVQVISSDEEDQLESECPNLDLALWGEKKSSNKRVIPLFELLAKNNNDHGKCPEIVADKCEEDSLGSLSLSLAVPFSDKMVQMVKPVAKEEPERNHIDTSLLLFGGFSGT